MSDTLNSSILFCTSLFYEALKRHMTAKTKFRGDRQWREMKRQGRTDLSRKQYHKLMAFWEIFRSFKNDNT